MKGNEKIVEMLNALLSDELGDNGTKEMLDSILSDEEAHIDNIEGQRDQISQMGIATYFGQQM